MRIKEINYSIVKIPLKQTIKHARRTFSTTESIVIKLQVDEYIGFGECCPRKYVGGVSINEIAETIESLRRKLLGKKITDIYDFLNFCNKLGINNHLKAALDIAFTDAYCSVIRGPYVLWKKESKNS